MPNLIKYYPYHTHILNQYRRINGQHVGISESQIVFQNIAEIGADFAVCTSVLPNYHKALYGDNVEMSYHISGYGISREEALVRLLGEGIERYSLLMSSVFHKDNIIYASFDELQAKYTNMVIPWDCISIYGDEEYKKFGFNSVFQSLKKTDVIGWLKCPSMFSGEANYYIPSQMLFIGNRGIDFSKKEVSFTPAFSKGTATHVSIRKALCGAISEIVEADAFMLTWFCGRKAKRVIIDDIDLLETFNKVLKNTHFEINVFDCTVSDGLGYVFAVMLKSTTEEKPRIVMGCASGFNPKQTVYRAFMEAVAITYLIQNGPIAMPKDYMNVCSDDQPTEYVNLDSNVAYWASDKDMDLKMNMIEKICSNEYRPISSYGELKNDLNSIISNLKKISKYAVCFDITPPELIKEDLHIMRVFVPELVQMSFPSIAPSKHPRVIKYGGLQRDVLPHPLP